MIITWRLWRYRPLSGCMRVRAEATSLSSTNLLRFACHGLSHATSGCARETLTRMRLAAIPTQTGIRSIVWTRYWVDIAAAEGCSNSAKKQMLEVNVVQFSSNDSLNDVIGTWPTVTVPRPTLLGPGTRTSVAVQWQLLCSRGGHWNK